MSKLPRAEELPRSEEGYDPARVEEAFASFADRVRELESVAGELRAELRSLRTERSGIRGTAAVRDVEAWPREPGDDAAPTPSPVWIGSVPAPVVRPPGVPRIALELAFLLLVALFAGLADLGTVAIVAVMGAAWAIVVASEWAAAAKRARWRLEDVAAPAELDPERAGESTGPWSMPVVHATVVDLPDGSESHTVVATLPSEPQHDEAEEPPAEHRRRFRLPWRRSPAPASDPWET